jgi:hypothetical protein
VKVVWAVTVKEWAAPPSAGSSADALPLRQRIILANRPDSIGASA